MPPLLENPMEWLIDCLETGRHRRLIGLAGVPGSGAWRAFHNRLPPGRV